MSTTATESKSASKGSLRAEALANRLLEGVDALISFVEEISADEWNLPVSITDKRPIGVIVHHVASMYPIEIVAVQAIAGGNAVTDVTWEAVAQINAQHAAEFQNVTKAEAIDLLRRNAKDAASVISALTDEQLDTAAPFSLSYGAPMTAQFVVEDHPLRHSWHHLYRIRKALGR